MHEQGFTRVQADGELLHQLWQEDASFGPSLSESLSKFSGTSGPDQRDWMQDSQTTLAIAKEQNKQREAEARAHALKYTPSRQPVTAWPENLRIAAESGLMNPLSQMGVLNPETLNNLISKYHKS